MMDTKTVTLTLVEDNGDLFIMTFGCISFCFPKTKFEQVGITPRVGDHVTLIGKNVTIGGGEVKAIILGGIRLDR